LLALSGRPNPLLEAVAGSTLCRTATPVVQLFLFETAKKLRDGDDNSCRSVILGRMTIREGYHRLKGGWQPSAAERRVLDELAAGRTNAEIAVRLGPSPETVKSHISRILGETGCADRSALARWWQQRQAARTAATIAALAPGVLLLIVGVPAIARVASSVAPGRSLVTTMLPPDLPLPTPTPFATLTPTPNPGIPLPEAFVWLADGASERLHGVRALAVDTAGNS
jgi:DNA-binding CsgD family transcriptional regulator